MFVWILELMTNFGDSRQTEVLGIFEDQIEANAAYITVSKMISPPDKNSPDSVYLYPIELNTLYSSDYNSKVVIE